LAQWTLDVRQSCDALGIGAPIVLGHSLGGIVAMVYATSYPASIQIDPQQYVDSADWRELFRNF